MSELGAALGIHIRELRMARNMSQEELGFKSCISAAHLGQIERAIKNPTIDTLERIASALGITLQELFDFHTPVTLSGNATLDKITAYLSALPEEQQKDLFKVIKLFKRVRESD